MRLNIKRVFADCKIVRANVQQPRLYTAMVLILIFSEVLGLYGLIVSILMLSRSMQNVTDCRY